MANLNLLESVLLGIVARRPSAGYDIRRYLEHTGRTYGYVPQPSQIYRQLATLVKRDLLEYTIDSGRSGPDAKVYSLTKEGVRAFLQWADDPFTPSERPLDAHFQLNFSLIGTISPVIALRLVETELEFRIQQEATWTPERLTADKGGLPFDQDWLDEISSLGHARGNALASVHISWLRTTADRLRLHIERTGATWPDPTWLPLTQA